MVGFGEYHLSSGPPNFRTILRKENIVPNINFASSSALSALGCEVLSPSLLDCVVLLEELVGLGIHFFLKMHSAGRLLVGG